MMITNSEEGICTVDRKKRTEWYEQGDTLYYACDFLGVRSILRLASTSRYFLSALMDSDKAARFWCSYVENIITKAIPSTVKDNRHISLNSLDYTNTLKRLLTGRLENLERSIIRASSCDRGSEHPNNTLSVSVCFRIIKANQSRGGLLAQNLELVVQAMHCLCAQSEPCYWSSGAHFPDNFPPFYVPVEYLTIGLWNRSGSNVCVVGFSVTPYQAFFQPCNPIYAPKYASLQLIAPREGVAESSGTKSQYNTNEFQPVTSDGELCPELDDTIDGKVYYESPLFAVPHVADVHTFYLPNPTLVVNGRIARLVFRGMHQRQSLQEAEEGIEQIDLDGYYLCLSNVRIIGTHVTEDSARSDSYLYYGDMLKFQESHMA